MAIPLQLLTQSPKSGILFATEAGVGLSVGVGLCVVKTTDN
jgi:hypothetical protein